MKAFYDAQVAGLAQTLLQDQPVDSTVTLPLDEFYRFPRTDSALFVSESAASPWVPKTTLTIGDAGAGGYAGVDLAGLDKIFEQYLLGVQGAFDDFDAQGAIGRGRVMDPRYRFTVKKVATGAWPFNGVAYEVVSVEFRCKVEDLYDFNYESPGAAAAAAGMQIGHGNGNNGRTKGKIYRNSIEIWHTYAEPFTVGTSLLPPTE